MVQFCGQLVKYLNDDCHVVFLNLLFAITHTAAERLANFTKQSEQTNIEKDLSRGKFSRGPRGGLGAHPNTSLNTLTGHTTNEWLSCWCFV